MFINENESNTWKAFNEATRHGWEKIGLESNNYGLFNLNKTFQILF